LDYSYNTARYIVRRNQACLDTNSGESSRLRLIKLLLIYRLTLMFQSDYIKVQALTFQSSGQSRRGGQKALEQERELDYP